MDVQIHSQMTPNPKARKFILDRDVKAEGKVSYTEPEACQHIPLVQALLALPTVTQVHLFENIITITGDHGSWEQLSTSVEDTIRALIDNHDPAFPESVESTTKADNRELSPELQKIDSILDRTIRPSLQMDGGDLELVELDGNVLSIRYQGACGGCPSALYGTLAAIESILNEEFRPDLEVVVV